MGEIRLPPDSKSFASLLPLSVDKEECSDKNLLPKDIDCNKCELRLYKSAGGNCTKLLYSPVDKTEKPPHTQAIVFSGPSGPNGGANKPILELFFNGDIYVKGNLVENDKEVVEGMRQFLGTVGS